MFIIFIIFFFQYGPTSQNLLKEACFVVNVLDPKVKKDLLSWFVKMQLLEYTALFAEGEEVSPLPHKQIILSFSGAVQINHFFVYSKIFKVTLRLISHCQ